MMLARAVVPSAVLVLVTLLVALPWGLGSDYRLVLPLLPAVVIYVWNSRRRDSVPEWMAFAAGVLLDAISQGPLGYWALLYLLAYILSALLRAPADEGGLLRWARFAVGMALLSTAAWLVASLYAMQPGDIAPLRLAGGIAVLTYPIVAGFVALLDPPMPHSANGNLVRGG